MQEEFLQPISSTVNQPKEKKVHQFFHPHSSPHSHAHFYHEDVSAHKCDHHHDHGHDHPHQHHLRKGIIGVLWGLALLFFPMVLSFFHITIPFDALYAVVGATALVTLYLGRHIYFSAAKEFKNKKLGTNALYTLSTSAILLTSISSFFIPGLPLLLEGASLILGLWHLGEAIEHSLKEKINSKLKMQDCAPKMVKKVLDFGGLEDCPTDQIVPGNIVCISAGEVIPVDGVLKKDAILNTSRLTGSSFPRHIKAGEYVSAGMQLLADQKEVDIVVTKKFEDSALARIDKNITWASQETEKAPLEAFTDRILKYFTPLLLITAVISSIIVGILFTPALAIQCAISVLVSACPCTLSFITPSSVKIGMSKAGERGIQFKHGKALQAAADIDVVVFDLNGTLTKGEVQVNGIELLDQEISEERFLQYAALLEKDVRHPFAQAISHYINARKIPANLALCIREKDNTHHSGVKATIDDQEFVIGSADILKANEITVPDSKPDACTVYLARNAKVIGKIILDDPLRDEARAIVQVLHRSGKEVHICTGADQETAFRYADSLGISKAHVLANCIADESKEDNPSTKVAYIEKLQHERRLKVTMVGDAANDAAAVAKSNFGIAIASHIGDDITQSKAGAVIQDASLMPIVSTFEVAKKTKRNIVQNLFLSLAYNMGVTALGAGALLGIAGFALNPVIGVLFMLAETSIVLLNTLWFKCQALSTYDYEDNYSRFQHTTSYAGVSNMLSSESSQNKSKLEVPVVPQRQARVEHSSLSESKGGKRRWSLVPCPQLRGENKPVSDEQEKRTASFFER